MNYENAAGVFKLCDILNGLAFAADLLPYRVN